MAWLGLWLGSAWLVAWLNLMAQIDVSDDVVNDVSFWIQIWIRANGSDRTSDGSNCANQGEEDMWQRVVTVLMACVARAVSVGLGFQSGFFQCDRLNENYTLV